MNPFNECSNMDDMFCSIVSSMGDSRTFLRIRQWVDQSMHMGTSRASIPDANQQTLDDIARAAFVLQAVRAGIVKVGSGTSECFNLFEPSWRLKTFFEGRGKPYRGEGDYEGSVLVACKHHPSAPVYEGFGLPARAYIEKVEQLQSAGKVFIREVASDDTRPLLPLQQRAKWAFIKRNVDERQGLWKTGNSARLLVGVSEEIQLNDIHDVDRAHDDIFVQWLYKKEMIIRTPPTEDCAIVAISYKHCGPNRMSRDDFRAIASALGRHFRRVRLWVDACIRPGSDVIKWVHFGLTPYVCMPVIILRNAGYDAGFHRVWITLERRLAQKGCPIMCVGEGTPLEQGKGVSEHDNIKSVCSDLLSGRISKEGLTVASDHDDLVKWARSVLMLPPTAVPTNDGALDVYYESEFAQKILMSNELSKVNGGAERSWIDRPAVLTGRGWTKNSLYCIEDQSPFGETCTPLPDGVLENTIVLDVIQGTPGEVYEAPCWFSTSEGTLVYKIKLRVSALGKNKYVSAVRKLPCAMNRPFEDMLAAAMLLGDTTIEVRRDRKDTRISAFQSNHIHDMWVTSPGKYRIVKGSEVDWE